ncbi:hypothetical protein HY256_07450 [Candidatus Sumerlaeota bacterium]|nr:hypothetical protein [Candidatus Sumerlaeota bacterium]
MGKRRRNIPEETFPRPAQAPVLWMIVIVLAALASYLPVLRAGYVWDDTALTDNELISSPGGLAKIWFHPASNLHEQHYWPMVYTTFWIEHKLWGFAPRGYHIVNVLLHAVNSLLLGLILKRARIRGAWGAAALFALHPVHVESVAWVIERKDVL